MNPHRNITKMLNHLKLQSLQNKTLLLTMTISLLLHGLLLTKFSLTLPELDKSYQTLDMRLVNLRPTQKTTLVPIKQSAPKPETIPVTTPEQTTKPNPDLETKTDVSQIEKVPSVIEKPAVESKHEIEQALVQTTTEPSSTEIIDSVNALEINGSSNPFSLSPYLYVETVFDVRKESDAKAVGITRIIFNLDKKSGSYTLSSMTEANGLPPLLLDPLKQKSEGLVTLNGLIPNLFTYQDNDNQIQNARFVWENSVLEISSVKDDKTESLVAGTQDILSVMYQFMFTQPRNDTQINITNGKNLYVYAYHFEGEKVITTKLGQLKTLHLLQNGTEKEKTELWLAVDYQYLPVQIRKTEKDGSIIEQTATEIYSLPNSN